MIDTQTAAWEAVKENLGEKQKEVYAMIARFNEGLTAFELTRILDRPINCISGRITELRKAGLIKDSGRRIPNPESGKLSTVWQACQ